MPLSPVFHILGILLSLLAATMVIPAAVDYFYGHQEWSAFIAAGLITKKEKGLK
jgi:trk system potassium uptake protein TrkH